MDKTELRKETLKRLESLEKKDHKEKSDQLASLLFQTEQWKRAHTIGITLSRYPEINTETIILKAWEAGKTTAIPETIYPGNKMQFRKYQKGDRLIRKKFDLLEPNSEAELIPKKKLDLLIVPGVLFNSEGYRIGFGGGFYDRFLTDFSGDTISLLFSEQLSREIIPEAHDIPVKKLLSV
ncbi:5-formyltetrahydrofolate cyclo-ligase [Listeria floridensis FSL S10-1187]|uniref:5-formyltetrahydrofolate cyclo-ligase n=1 Tax=Listeria floridensis FSL S10-1187 TaxID=1265817 RepID=A0ABP3AZ42_9LIST|nr:5-formyltetrahydrofolate cyclo-ligase [Listeria floridensis]EUJ31761.1 5-formyltetrahydrofolate cyclo-ligase [Listeria floridensis FSL S10-1187]